MAFKDGNSPSTGPKLSLGMLTLLGVIFSIRHVEFGFQPVSVHNGFLIACALIFWIRLAVSLFAFIKRKVSWFEGIVVGVLYGILVAGFSVWGTQKNFPFILWDITGMGLFCLGSVINSLSDYQRHVWKMRTENQWQLYTKGLFRYSMHINYFGDSIMFIGFAIITQNAMSFIPVAIIVLNLVFLQIPRLDDHLKIKYGADFLEYERKTKKFIPFIF